MLAGINFFEKAGLSTDMITAPAPLGCSEPRLFEKAGVLPLHV
jgi:hypothetical protein